MQVKAVCFFCLRKVWQLVAITLVLIAVLVSVFRYSLPYANDYKHDLETLIAEQLDVELRIGSISASWEGSGPALVLEQLSFADNNTAPISIQLEKTSLQINVIQSLKSMQLRSDYFVLEGFIADVNLKALTESSRESTSSFEQQSLIENLFLGESGHFAIKNSELNLTMASGREHQLLLKDLIWQNNVHAHRGTGLVAVPGLTQGNLSANLLLTGKTLAQLAGEIYLEATSLDLQDWFSPYLDPQKEQLYSDINGQLWLTMAQGRVKQIQANWLPSHVYWQEGSEAQKLSLVTGQVLLKPTIKGWSLDSTDFVFEKNAQPYPSFKVQGELADTHQLWFNNADVSLVADGIALTNLIDSEVLTQLAPSGKLSGKVSYDPQTGMHYWLNGQDLAWQHVAGAPGVKGLQVEVAGQSDKGAVRIFSEQSQLLTGELFIKPIGYEQLSGELNYYLEHDVWHLSSDSIWLNNTDMTLAAELQLRLAEQVELDLYAELKGGSGKQANLYYPQTVMASSLIDYLNSAIIDGQHLESQVLLSGVLSDFPYTQQNGRFEVLSKVANAEFKFAPDWPAINKASAKLHFANERMDIYVDEGTLINQQIQGGVTVSLANLEQADTLRVAIVQTTQAQTLAPFFAQTPLKEPLEEVLTVVQANGEVSGDITLDIDLNELDVLAKGRVEFDDIPVFLAQPGMQLNNVTGSLTFEDDKIALTQATATWLDMPLSLSVQGYSKAQDYLVDIDTQLEASSEKLLPHGHGLMDGFLAGQTQLATKVNLAFAPQGFNYTASFSSDLVGVESLLAAPYNKPPEQAWQLSGQVRGDDISNLITASITDKLHFNGILDNNTGKLSNAHIIAGAQDRGLSSKDFEVSIEQANIALLPWVRFIDRIIDISSQPSTGSSLLPPLNEITAQIDSLTINDIPFNEFEMRMQPNDEGMRVRLNAKELRANVIIPESGSSRPIDIKSDYLRLNIIESEEETPTEKPTPDSLQWLARIPAIELYCADCKLKTYQLDQVSLSLFGDGEKLHISELVVDKQDHVLRAQGSWYQGVTEFTGIMNSSDIGELFSEFDLTSAIQDSEANMEYSLSWQAAPYDFDTETLSGDIKWRLGDGHLSEISDQGARVFSLLSLDSLVRKLKLDFRDVFSKGFFYNSMQGSMQLAKGVAYTKDTKMDGVPADLTIQGHADLNTNKINYDLAVAPQVTSSLPVIVGWMVNPVTGLAALALDQVLHSARVISEIKFKITGTMQEPIVTEVDRKSREVELPQAAQNEPPAEGEEQPKPDTPPETQKPSTNQPNINEGN